jgi:hypothetical protein
VPLVLTDLALYETNYQPDFPAIDRHLQEQYENRGRFPPGNGAGGVGVLVSKSAGWTHTDAETGLPCGVAVAGR